MQKKQKINLILGLKERCDADFVSAGLVTAVQRLIDTRRCKLEARLSMIQSQGDDQSAE